MKNDKIEKTKDLIPKDLKTDCYLIMPDGTKKSVIPESGSSFTLAELQAMVGGYIEPIFMGDIVIITNEDGRSHGLPYNDEATKIYRNYYKTDDPNQFLVGDVLLCPSKMLDN